MKMHMQGIAFPKREIYYVTSIFLGIDSTSQQTPEEEDAYIYNIVQKFVRSFSCIACINITETERLCKTLMHHMRPLFYRMKYGVLSQNILVKDVRRMYPDVFDFTERAAIDAGLNGISEDEIASLCVYPVSYTHLQRIIEMSFGDYEGKCCSKSNWELPEKFRRFFDDPVHYEAPCGGEDFIAVSYTHLDVYKRQIS